MGEYPYSCRAAVAAATGQPAPIPTDAEAAALEIARLRAALEAWAQAERLEVEIGQSWRTDRAYREARVLRDAALGAQDR